MGSELLKAGMAAVIVGVAGASTALAADAEVVIGNLDDLSGVYSDDGGPGSVEAEKWRSRISAARYSAARSSPW